MPAWRSAVCATAMVLSFVAPAVPAQADDSRDRESRGVFATTVVEAEVSSRASFQVSDALLEDMAIAQSQMPDVDLSTMAYQDAFAVAITAIQENHGADYTASWIDTESGEFWMAVPAALTDDVAGELAELPIDVYVVEHTGIPEAEFTHRINEVHGAVLTADGVVDASTGGDPLTGVITSTINLESGQTVGPARTAGLAAARRLGLGVGAVEVLVEERLIGAVDTLYGGSQLSGACTAGFAVRSSSYSNGILTAAHCSNDQSPSGGDTLVYRGAAALSTGDVQWHSSSGSTLANFYISSTTRRPVYATANPVDGAIYCRYGRTTGNYCDQVYMLNRCRGSYCGLVMMFERLADGGDSGGPWYSGYTAFGIHSGYAYYLGNKDVWSPIRPAVTSLGVTVKVTTT